MTERQLLWPGFGQADELRQALERAGYTTSYVTQLIQHATLLGDVRGVLDGKMQIVPVEAGPEATPTPKFELLVDLGEIAVPNGYDHATRLAVFGKQNRKKFYGYNNALTDANFANPSRVLKPGDRLGVRAFRQIVPSTSSEERLALLVTQNAVLTGAQGASLVWEQKRELLPRGKWYLSMDHKDRLPFVDGSHWVPSVSIHSVGGFSFSLDSFGRPWDGDDVLFCFRDLAQPSGA
jgi:hypothetical protein